MGKLLTTILAVVSLMNVYSQQSFPLQMEGEYICEIRYGCAAPFRLEIQRDSSDPTRFNFIDSCPNAFSGSVLCKMMADTMLNPNEFRINGPFCFFEGEFFPNSDSLYGVRDVQGCGSGCTCGLYYKCKKVNPVGLEEKLLEKLQISPNPVVDRLQVKFFNGNVDYQILNSLGQLQQVGTLYPNASEINLTDLPQGIYVVRFEQKGQVHTHKFLKE